MDTRRFQKHSRSRALAQFRWLGWVMLMMFVLVQTAMGADAAGGRSERSRELWGIVQQVVLYPVSKLITAPP